jgi:RNA polymerase sigma factor (sigma-70 family)
VTISETIGRVSGNQEDMETKRRRGTTFEAPRRAYEMLVRDHLKDIRGWVIDMGVPPGDRDDVVQEVLIGACRALHTQDPARGTLRAWLKGITRHRVWHHLRRLRRRPEQAWPDEALDPADQGPSSEALLVDENERQLVRDLLGQLSAASREVLTAFAIDGLGLNEVAEQLRLTVAAVKSRLFRARRELKAAAHRFTVRHGRLRLVLLPLDLLGGQTALLRRIGRALRSAFTRATERGAPLSRRIEQTLLGPSTNGLASASISVLLLLGPGLAGDDVPAAQAPATAAGSLAAPTPASGKQARGELPSDVVTPRSTRGRPRPPKMDSAPSGAPKAPAQPALALTREANELQLQQMVMAALAVEQEDLARALLEQHRREFPRGRFAEVRDQLLRRWARTATRE